VIGNSFEKYRLAALGTYCGDAGDSLTYHVGMKFSTYDQDNDNYGDNCAQQFHGAWWYNACHHSNLNGKYVLGGNHTSYADGANWLAWTGYYYSLKKIEMKIRPEDF